MYGRFYAQKLHFFRSRYQKATVRVQVKSSFFFFPTNYFLEI